MSKKVYVYSCFGETLEFAESLGWVDTHPSGDEWAKLGGGYADAVEEECFWFIKDKGWTIVFPDEEKCDG